MIVIRETSPLETQPRVATIGFFDGVHAGHCCLIRQVREIARARDLRAALVTFPLHPRQVMQPGYPLELLTTPAEKAELLARTGVDDCLMFDFTPEISRLTAREFMLRILKERYQVVCLVIGYDHRFGHDRSEEFDDYCRYGEEIGIEVIRANAYAYTDKEHPEEIRVSSSLIRRSLHRGEVDKAACYLGYPYFINGTVVDGHKVGRQLGFPTANLLPGDPDKLLPSDGVYAVWVDVEGQRYKGMLNIGMRPTLNNGPERTIEVHLLHFQGDMYQKNIRVSFIRRTRPELKFDTLEALTARIRQDAQEIETLLGYPPLSLL